MSSPILTNTPTQLNGGSLVVGFATTLTDAQIKALPTTPVTLVAAPASGYRIKVLGGTARLNSSAGAYTNINTTYSVVQIEDPSGDWLTTPVSVNDSSLGVALTQTTALLGAAATVLVDLAPIAQPIGSGAASGNGEYFLNNGPVAVANVSAQVVRISANNNGAGNYTGGNVANRLLVTLYIAYEAV